MDDSALSRNAVLARSDRTAAQRTAVVTGDDSEANYWLERLRANSQPWQAGNDKSSLAHVGPLVLTERGKRGNFLGTLTAYRDARLALDPDASYHFPLDQIVMLLGSGTRLSPFTQALRNIKAAFPLPDADSPPAGLTVGEAAIRAGSPLIAYLRSEGFNGFLVRWGDEITIPSADFRSCGSTYTDVDVVRFGWRTHPTPQLATQKEWLIVDSATQTVVGEFSRQPLESLQREISRVIGDRADLFVNLGSFAATQTFLGSLLEAFDDHISKVEASANWDPYFWMAFHSKDEAAWHGALRAEREMGRTGMSELLAAIPNFFELVCEARRLIESRLGRPARVKVLDFGEPYWIDAGDHVALHRMYADVFHVSQEGEAVRAFFGLPESLTNGDSVVHNSDIGDDAVISGSVVIGARVRDSSSKLHGAIVLGGDYGLLRIDAGGVAIQSISANLSVTGPNAVVFRFTAPQASVGPGESLSTIFGPNIVVQMRYRSSEGTITRELYESVICGNPISYSELAQAVSSADPFALESYWTQYNSKSQASRP